MLPDGLIIVKGAAVDCMIVLVILKRKSMTTSHQHLALNLIPTLKARDRICCRERLLFLMVVTCISGVITLNCHLLPG